MRMPVSFVSLSEKAPGAVDDSRVKLRSFPRFFPSALLAAMGRSYD
jgi:hypothetical protein